VLKDFPVADSSQQPVNLLAGTSLIPFALVDKQVLYIVSAAPAVAGDRRCECGAPLRPNGTRTLTVADLPLHGRNVRLEIELPRLLCSDCGKSISLRPADLHPERQMTARLVEHIERAGLERPYAEIAREIGVSEATVSDICTARILRLIGAYRPEAPRVLCIDEVHIRKGLAYAVISDHDAVQIIDVLPDDRKETVRAALRRLRHPERCRIVTMDMCRRYRDVVREELPAAVIVVDKFHVLKMARECMVTVVGEQYRHLPRPCALSLAELKGLMIKRRHGLKKDQRVALDTALAGSAYLAEAYRKKEALCRLYDFGSHQAAAQHLSAWLASLSPGMRCAYKKLATALGNWRLEILAYWQAPERASNGPAEALNGVIKRINAAGGRRLPLPLLRARAVHGERRRRRREALRRALARTRRR
jgi:transposase